MTNNKLRTWTIEKAEQNEVILKRKQGGNKLRYSLAGNSK